MSNNVGEIPKEVMKGFAEYGANFFALYNYDKRQLNGSIYCISEKPFTLKMGAKWKESAKASLAKKLIAIEEKAAGLCQIINQQDYSVVNAGDTTYDRYAGVENISYDAQMTVLNAPYTSVKAEAKLSTPADVEDFLAQNALPRVDNKITKTLVNNFAQVAVDTPRMFVDTMSTIKETSSSTQDVTTNLSILREMITASKKLRALTDTYKEKYAAAIRSTVTKYVLEKLSDGKKLSTSLRAVFSQDLNRSNAETEITKRFRIKMNGGPNSDSYYLNLVLDGYTNQHYDIIGITDFYDSLLGLQEKANSEGFAYEKIYEFYKTKWTAEVRVNSPSVDCAVPWVRLLRFFKISINDKDPEDAVIPTDKCKEITDLNDEYESFCKVIIDETNSRIASLGKNAQKVKESKSKLEELADSFITFQPEFGDFNQRISPLVLFYSVGGMICADHVIIKSWTETPDLWGFNSKFSINMEKAEIESYPDFYSNRMFKPDC
jgi:hypothetical protein